MLACGLGVWSVPHACVLNLHHTFDLQIKAAHDAGQPLPKLRIEDGYRMDGMKADFKARFGYDLDNKRLGECMCLEDLLPGGQDGKERVRFSGEAGLPLTLLCLLRPTLLPCKFTPLRQISIFSLCTCRLMLPAQATSPSVSWWS